MKVSELTVKNVAEFIRLDEYDEKELKDILEAAKSYAKNYTNLAPAQMDENEEISIAVLILCQDMYDNRAAAADAAAQNKTLTNILNMHSYNLV